MIGASRKFFSLGRTRGGVCCPSPASYASGLNSIYPPKRSSLTPELNANLKAEVALAVVASGEVVAKAGQLIIPVHQPDPEVLMARIVLIAFRESLVHKNLYVDPAVQVAPLWIGICCCRMRGAVTSGSDNPTHGNISPLEKIVGDGCGAIFAEFLVELFCSGAGGIAGYFD
jgi:hypothetical protein